MKNSLINHGRNSSDDWLTPPELLKALGNFDMDVCCPENMPWKIAPIMFTKYNNGLIQNWCGFVWCNPPYSDIMPWIDKMTMHNNGIMLLPAKSPETRWGQKVLNNCSVVYFLAGRLLFHYIDGKKSVGKWSPYMLCGFGEVARERLLSIKEDFPGILFKKDIICHPR